MRHDQQIGVADDRRKGLDQGGVQPGCQLAHLRLAFLDEDAELAYLLFQPR